MPLTSVVEARADTVMSQAQRIAATIPPTPDALAVTHANFGADIVPFLQPLLTKLAGGLKSFQVQPDAPLAQ